MFVIAKSMNNYVFSKSNCGGKTPSIQSVLITQSNQEKPSIQAIHLFCSGRTTSKTLPFPPCSEIQKKRNGRKSFFQLKPINVTK